MNLVAIGYRFILRIYRPKMHKVLVECVGEIIASFVLA